MTNTEPFYTPSGRINYRKAPRSVRLAPGQSVVVASPDPSRVGRLVTIDYRKAGR